MKKIYKNQKGSVAMILSILLLSIVFVISTGITVLIFNQIKMSSQIGQSVVAFYAAESGAERCLYDVRKYELSSCSYSDIQLDFNSNAKYTTTYNNSPPIESTGIFVKTSRAVELNW